MSLRSVELLRDASPFTLDPDWSYTHAPKAAPLGELLAALDSRPAARRIIYELLRRHGDRIHAPGELNGLHPRQDNRDVIEWRTFRCLS